VAPSPFDTLGVEPRFDLDMAALEKRHRTLSGTLHPDRYVARPPSERRMALDRAIAVNEAWRALRDPIQRAESLLSLGGVPVGETKEPKAPPELLMEMMEVREELADAKEGRDLAHIAKIGDAMRQRERETSAALAAGFVGAGDNSEKLAALLPLLGELRYLRRFFEELDAIEEQLLG
jgi:molecular chaperone HscB